MEENGQNGDIDSALFGYFFRLMSCFTPVSPCDFFCV